MATNFQCCFDLVLQENWMEEIETVPIRDSSTRGVVHVQDLFHLKINKLTNEYEKIRNDILIILKQINNIVGLTPIGCAGMFCELFGLHFFNSNTMSTRFRSIYDDVDGNGQICFEKMSLASAVDAFHRKKKKFLEMTEKTHLAETILAKITALNPNGFHSNGRVVHHNIFENSGKNNEIIFCEFCDGRFNFQSVLIKHQRKNHAMEFANSMIKYYSTATELATPNILEALSLMKCEVFGLDKFEILLDPEKLQILNQHLRRIEINSNNTSSSKRNAGGIDGVAVINTPHTSMSLSLNPHSAAVNLSVGSLLNQHPLSSQAGLFFEASNSRIPSSGRGSATLRSGLSQESSSSLKSLDVPANRVTASNAIHVSTLTGSSEAEMQSPTLREVHDNSSDSLGSSLSMSLGGHSASVSPGQYFSASRRYSLTVSQADQQADDSHMFGQRQALIRRSARNGTVLDPKIRVAPFRPPLLALKTLFFQVPQQENIESQLFWGRSWIYRDIASQLLPPTSSSLNGQLMEMACSNRRGVILSGSTGSGKTSVVLQLVEYSCFGRSRISFASAPTRAEYIYDNPYSSTSGESIYGRTQTLFPPATETIQSLATRVVAYHFCQADNSSTCLVPDFVHSIAAQLCQAPQMVAYRQLLLSDPHLQSLLSLKECIANPHSSFINGILEPLSSLKQSGEEEGFPTCLMIVDGLCEAEYHRPDYGDTISSFLVRHSLQFPIWLKVVVTVRSGLQNITQLLPYASISLDAGDWPIKDLLDYTCHRVNNCATIRSNVMAIAGVNSSTGSEIYGTGSQGLVARFAAHLSGLARSNFLHAKMSLDLIEQGHLVTKSASFKVLPVTLSEIFLLNFNLRFASLRAYEQVQPILCVCLASLNPMTLLEIYHTVNAMLVTEPLTWEEFMQRVKLLKGLLVKRSDDTYMLFHPSFREWLIRREDDENTKFLCDPRTGHASIALRLSRLEAPLDAEKTMELGHHILKANLYTSCGPEIAVPPRELQAVWVALSADDVSASLGTIRNLFSPNVNVSRLLLLGGASPNHITEMCGNSPLLCLYAQEGLTDMVSLLLEFGANCNVTNKSGVSILSLAAERGHCDIVRMLVQNGAQLSQVDNGGSSALLYAAQMGHLNVVSYLLSCDWSADGRFSDNELTLSKAAQQALIVAAGQGHAQVLEFLLDMAEVRVNLPDSLRGQTALTAAATAGHFDICRILVRRWASHTVTNLTDVTALICAVQEGHWEVAESLLQESLTAAQQPPPQIQQLQPNKNNHVQKLSLNNLEELSAATKSSGGFNISLHPQHQQQPKQQQQDDLQYAISGPMCPNRSFHQSGVAGVGQQSGMFIKPIQQQQASHSNPTLAVSSLKSSHSTCSGKNSPSASAVGSINYSNLYERVNQLEKQLIEEKRLRIKLEEEFRRDTSQPKNQNKPLDLVRGGNRNVNDFLARSKEQSEFKYYLIDGNGTIRCHCADNPPAFFVSAKNYWMCPKRTKKAGKCCLYIPNNLL